MSGLPELPEDCGPYALAWCDWTEAHNVAGDLVPMIYWRHPECPEHGETPEVAA